MMQGRVPSAFLLGFALVFSAVLPAHTLEEAKLMLSYDVDPTTLIIKFRDDAKLKFERGNLTVNGRTFSLSLRNLASPTPLFTRGTEVYQKERELLERTRRESLPHLDAYATLRFRNPVSRGEGNRILTELYQRKDVAFAYFEPRAKNAVLDLPFNRLAMDRAATPDYEPKQFHLDGAPQGVEARYAWEVPGGTGVGIKVVDIEYGWNLQHEDLPKTFFNFNGSSYVDHGTAVFGEIAAKKDDKGVTGIAYEVKYGVDNWTSANTYDQAAAKLSPGDVMVIEQHQPGPDNGNYTAMEYWKANFDALKLATAKGIIVVAAAGNGNSNFDNAVYQGAFDLANRDSGCILVGAGGPPGNTHLQRLSFSNYGSRVDAMGYGYNVVTTGYGDLFNGGQNRMYTAQFSGTSSATPIVAGSIASLSGMARAQSKVLSPLQIRDALRNTGTKQQGNTTERIGNLPDLTQLHEALLQ